MSISDGMVICAFYATQPVYEALFGFHVFGLGFVTSMGFIIGTGELCCILMLMYQLRRATAQAIDPLLAF